MEFDTNSPQARKTAEKYADIIGLSRPETEESLCRHPRMTIENRAKIFSPFAALRGYEQVIETQTFLAQSVARQIPSEEEADKLSRFLSKTSKGDFLALTYFEGDTGDLSKNQTGFYRKISGKVEQIDYAAGYIRINGRKIPFSAICRQENCE